MASDRARISFDPTRDYRAVVAQQGRVTLEADVNEASVLQSEALRLETIDIVGPAGTPDNGYAVTPGGSADQSVVAAGIYYLGGWRLSLVHDVTIGAQPDWLDRPAPSENQGGNSVVSLLLTEQSVGAVEDPALREVALGGPDSAARLRLMQHILVLPMDGATCADGAARAASALAADGVSLDPYSYELLSGATLQVGFTPGGPPPDACSPAAAGGYLGADNQLIRVTVSAFDPKANTGALLWGWNNASILYRAAFTDKVAGVLTLAGAPLDQEHAPQLGQAVEILRSRADLGDGAYVAADSGFVTTVTQAYSFDTGTLTVADIADLPPEYLTDPNPLFVRLWQGIAPFTAGQPAPLDTVSGLTVTVSLKALPGQIAARPFWRFAVRPDTPVQVYPARYLQAPQPPDGPRQWLCDLAVVGGVGDGLGLLADCRPTFTALTEQTGGCCGLTLDPAGVQARGGLQAVVDSLAGGPAVLSLKSGTYPLSAPLVLTARHGGLTIEGCAAGVIFRAAGEGLAVFAFGLVIVDAAVAVAVRGVAFDVPFTPAVGAATTGGQGGVVVGLLAVNTTRLTIEDCRFSIRDVAPGAFGGGVTVLGRTLDLTIRGCVFRGAAVVDGTLVCGVMATVNVQTVSTSLSEIDITDNEFQSLTAGVFAYARLGEVRCAGNRVRGCVTGFYFADVRLGAAGAFAKQALNAGPSDGGNLGQPVQAAFNAPWLAMSAQSQAPFFARAAQPAPEISPVVDEVLLQDVASRGSAIYDEIAGHASGLRMRMTGERPAAAQVAPGPSPYAAALDQVNILSLAAEVAPAVASTAALHLQDNDITLLSAGPNAAPGVGVGVLFSPKDAGAMLQLNGNRILCQDTRTCAAAALFPGFATVTGNLLLQPAGIPGVAGSAALIVLTLATALSAITGNVVRSGAVILPARIAPAPTADWSFFNTEG